MIGQSLWQNLKSLVEIDQKLEEVSNKIKKTEDILNTDKQAIPTLKNLIEENKNTFNLSNKKLTQQELKAQELKDEETKKKKILEGISNPKEYSAAKKELKLISQKHMEQDDILIKAWHQLEADKKEFEEKEKSLKEKIVQLEEGIEAQKLSLKDLQTEQEKVQLERNEAEKNIPADWLVKYNRMKHKVSNPIVPVIQSSCSACYYSILRQDLDKLKKSGVLPCRNCYRFLYYNQEEEKDAKEQSY